MSLAGNKWVRESIFLDQQNATEKFMAWKLDERQLMFVDMWIFRQFHNPRPILRHLLKLFWEIVLHCQRLRTNRRRSLNALRWFSLSDKLVLLKFLLYLSLKESSQFWHGNLFNPLQNLSYTSTAWIFIKIDMSNL